MATVHLEQDVPATPGQTDKQAMPIPLKLALFDRETGRHHGEELIVLNKASDTFRFMGHLRPPVLSINRGFTAPVTIETLRQTEDLVFLAARDDDAFARYEAMQSLVLQHLISAVGDGLGERERDVERDAISQAVEVILADDDLDDLMRGRTDRAAVRRLSGGADAAGRSRRDPCRA